MGASQGKFSDGNARAKCRPSGLCRSPSCGGSSERIRRYSWRPRAKREPTSSRRRQASDEGSNGEAPECATAGRRAHQCRRGPRQEKSARLAFCAGKGTDPGSSGRRGEYRKWCMYEKREGNVLEHSDARALRTKAIYSPRLQTFFFFFFAYRHFGYEFQWFETSERNN